jgi:hypothetical protein
MGVVVIPVLGCPEGHLHAEIPKRVLRAVFGIHKTQDVKVRSGHPSRATCLSDYLTSLNHLADS